MSNDILADSLRELNKTMKKIQETLVDHGHKFDILTKDAVKDEEPYDQRPCNDESTCTALYEMAMAKTKEEVEEWIKRMDVSLVFIALFSAVLTAFIIPATQNLFPNSNDTPSDSLPPLPSAPVQDVCVLFYLALIIAILNAILSLLGRQWMSKLTSRPDGTSYQERLLRHRAREELAKRWLKYLVEGLHILLLSSITLFMTGLLYQLRILGTSFEETSPRLLLIWQLGMGLSSVIVVTVIAATVHALFYEASPFGGSFSKLLIKLAEATQTSHALLPAITNAVLRTRRALPALYEIKQRITSSWEALISTPKNLRHAQPSSVLLHRAASLPRSILSLFYLPFALVLRWRVKVEMNVPTKLFMTYLELIAEASDSNLLERAAPSFSFTDWFNSHIDDSTEQLEKACRRLMASDVSLRVRQTIEDRFSVFKNSLRAAYRAGDGMIISRSLENIFAKRDSQISDFPKRVLRASREPNNGDLRPYALLSVEKCIGKILCSYDWQNPSFPNIGEREDIFIIAQDHCCDLLRQGREAEVMQILSTIDGVSLTRSLRKAHDGYDIEVNWDLYHFFFRQRILSISSTPNNKDLLSLLSLPFESCIANALCCCDRNGSHGNRQEVFEMADFYCYDLFFAEKESSLLQIISRVDPLSLIRSYAQCQYKFFPKVLGFITERCNMDHVRKINQFMRGAEFPHIRPLQVSCFLQYIPPAISSQCDLTHILRYLSQHRHDESWGATSTAAVSWLETRSIARIADRDAVRQFLLRCVQTDLRDSWGDRCETSEETRDRARSLLAELDQLPETKVVIATPNYDFDADLDMDLLFSTHTPSVDGSTIRHSTGVELPGASAAFSLTNEDHGSISPSRASIAEATAFARPLSRPSCASSSSLSVFEASPHLESARDD
ncbi:hypothetical protein SISNIDRAFT_489748 [Sistotremastrum niveocremeum HHB9708]|uniref:DUF6535 domain-containing protein n=1 Tax=Sistotremastrum niveocremeum HHB9708 TaxID=1314777 RepID=A0A164PNL9_9AGAM|nr:hypothetical protein SISNIDRAFT_489748 [Sistotremastrum niveocremeum HHB9708]